MEATETKKAKAAPKLPVKEIEVWYRPPNRSQHTRIKIQAIVFGNYAVHGDLTSDGTLSKKGYTLTYIGAGDEVPGVQASGMSLFTGYKKRADAIAVAQEAVKVCGDKFPPEFQAFWIEKRSEYWLKNGFNR